MVPTNLFSPSRQPRVALAGSVLATAKRLSASGWFHPEVHLEEDLKMVRGSYLLALLTMLAPASTTLARLAERSTGDFAGVAAQVPQESAFADLTAHDAAPASKLAPEFVPLSADDLIIQVKTADHDGQALAHLSTTPEPMQLPADVTTRRIHTDYQKAMAEATESRKMLFIYFHDPDMTPARRAFETRTLPVLEIQEKLKRYVHLELPTDAVVSIGGKQVKLLEHPSFSEMLGRSGVAIIDLVHERADFYGHVVSTFPFTSGKFYRKEALSIILDLPPGTLTQRTMIYAVRVHPEAPASTQGQFHTELAKEANSHAHYQASIQVQGHHSWDSRFQRINAKLPGNVLAQEVVAESWPNESLVEACVECVDSWRQSPGHWSAVRSRHPLFGYDIKRGRNGIWYATGIFGLRR
jgi:hypothetical protein